MNTSKFKYVVGEAKENEVCDIRLFCDIDEYTANSFNSEFFMGLRVISNQVRSGS